MLKKIILLAFLLACQNPEAELAQAKKLLENGQTDQALVLLKKHPKNDQALNITGIAYLEMGKAQESLTFFNEAIKLNNQEYKFFYNRGNAYMSLKQPQEALSDYQKAAELENNNADLYLNQGAAFFALNRLKEALAALNKAAQLSPENKNVFFNRGKTYILLEEYQKAVDDLHKAVHLDESFAKAHYFLASAEILLNAKPSPETCQHFQKALDLGYQEAQAELQKHCN